MWVEGGDELSPPPYAETVDVESEGSEEADESVVSETSALSQDNVDDHVEEPVAESPGDGGGSGELFDSYSSWNPAHRPS